MDLAIPIPPMETAILWQMPLNSSSLECTNAFIFFFFFLPSMPPFVPLTAGLHTGCPLYNCVYYNTALVPVYISGTACVCVLCTERTTLCLPHYYEKFKASLKHLLFSCIMSVPVGMYTTTVYCKLILTLVLFPDPQQDPQ